MINNTKNSIWSKYFSLIMTAGLGSVLGSGIIIGLSATIPVWQNILDLTTAQVGILSGGLTFAIAIGSFIAGKITQQFGLITSYNWTNFFYGLGAMLTVFAQGFISLLVGVLIMGFASGIDLPISLTVISCDAPDDSASAKMVSSTQVFWTMGIFLSYVSSFLVANTSEDLAARIVFILLAFISLGTWLWRLKSKNLQVIHTTSRQRAEKEEDGTESISIRAFFSRNKNKKYSQYFLAIVIFYVSWNLLANTWGQFQTYTLVQAEASQRFAMGAGVVLNIVALIASAIYSLVVGGKHRNLAFVIGIFIQFLAMILLAFNTNNLLWIVVAIGFYNIGSPFAGDAIYKVWTQESFPKSVRANIQGFTNGFSRLIAGLFAFITPFLVQPENIQTTMFAFAGVVMIAAIAGLSMMRLQKKYENV